MRVAELFNQAGFGLPVGGHKPQILDDAGFVYLVKQGTIAIFLVHLTPDNQPGVKKFLFEAGEGDLLFGIAPEGQAGKSCLLASGPDGSSLIRLEVQRLGKLLEGANAAEIIRLVDSWLRAIEQFEDKKEGLTGAEMVPAKSSLQELASTAEEMSGCGAAWYLNDPMRREYYNSWFLRMVIHRWEEEKAAEIRRLQEKADDNRRFLTNAISKLAALMQDGQTAGIQETSGDPLLDACRFIGRKMNIKIMAPPLNSDIEETNWQLDDIARASRIRTREVALQGEWYKQDNGPILGYMEEDNRPVALIPVSPAKYILHDFALSINKVVDRETAAQIKYLGFIFYRPLEDKKITLRDLLSFGFQSCWKRDLVALILMGVLGGVLGTAIPLATGIVFDSIIPSGESGQLLQIAFFLGASSMAAMLFQFTRSLAILRLEGKMDRTLQAAVWDRLLSLPVPFFKQFSAGELAMRAMGITQIRMILSGATLNAILSSLFSVFTFALLFYYDPWLAWIATVLVLMAILVMGCLGYWQVSYERKVLEISNNISGMVLQFIGGVTKFQVAGAESRAFHRWAQEFGKQRRLAFKKETLANALATFNAFFPVLSSMVIFYALTSTASLAPGQFIAFNAAFVNFMLSMVSLSESLMKVNLVIPLYQRAKPILETLPEYDATKVNPKTLTGSLEVSHLSFRYKEDGPLVLQDISFQINRGDYVALVGTSGCGKSTLFRILLGFEKPETGNVYYDGQDLAKVDIRAVRRQLGVVLQNGQLMSGNIFSNIVGANPYLTIDDAWGAARMAGIEEDIREMPMGMHTMVSEGTGTISGGQKQRIMIARAIVNKPRIIFFDEATSALDNRTQAIVSKSLAELRATRVVIAHRLSTIMNCDKIFVMDRGKIVERGTYQELMDKQGVFAELAKRQL